MSGAGPEPAARIPGKWAAAALYLALTVLFAYPLSLHPGRTLLSDDPDAHLYMWTLAWDTHAFLHQPLSIFDANIFYPNHHTLAYSENLIGSALFAAPVLWITRNPVLAVNLVSLLSCVLCGLGAYVLGRRIGLGAAAALLCGLIFALSPPRFFRINQLHLTTVQWIPFALASLHAYLDGGRRRDLQLAAGFFTLQTLTSGHGAVFLLLAIGILMACRFALGEPLAIRRRMADFNLAGLLWLAPAAALFIPYRMAQVEVGLRRGLGNWDTTPESFIASPSHVHVSVLSLMTGADPNATASAYLFPGYIPLLLTLVALVWRRRRSREATMTARPLDVWAALAFVVDVVLCAALALAIAGTVMGAVRLRLAPMLVLSARQPLRAWIAAAVLAGIRVALVRRVPFDPVGRLRTWHERWTRRVEPSRRDPVVVYLTVTLVCIWLSLSSPIGLWPLVYALPGFNFIRVRSRFMILGILGIAVLAGIGFERLTARLSAAARCRAAILVGILLAAEFAAFPLGVIPYQLDIPAADRWLAGQPTPFVVAEVPVTLSERYQSNYMLHSTAHWQKTVHGYSGIRPALHEALYQQLRAFPDQDSVEALARIGVTHVVVHTTWFPREERGDLERRLDRFQSWLTLEYDDSDAQVYSLHRPANVRTTE